MKNLEKEIKKRYLIFMLTIGIIIVSVVVIVIYNINLQNSDASRIRIAGKQSTISEQILNQVLQISRSKNNPTKPALKNLNDLTKELENLHPYLAAKNKGFGHRKIIDSLFKVVEPFQKRIVNASRAILSSPNQEVIESSLEKISTAEVSFQIVMDRIVNLYENEAIGKLQKLKQLVFFLAIATALILLGVFLFVIIPTMKELFLKNKELVNTNKELGISETRLNANMIELTKLKTVLEIKETYNKIFIEQAPTSIAMLDMDMKYMAVSQHWIEDYKMEGKDIIGRSHYDIFPEIGEDWKESHRKSLKGEIDICDEALFIRADGTEQWIYWDVRPWYISEGKIGGLLMHTGDITHLKEKEKERIYIEDILAKSNEVARIGTWEFNVATNKYSFGKITREILQLPDDFEGYKNDSLLFYKEGSSRNKIIKVFEEIIESGTPFDIELEMLTKEGNSIWVRKIGQAEIENGRTKRIYGIFQDISALKKAGNQLLKRNQLLSFAEEITLMGHWQWDTVANTVKWSDNLYKMFEKDITNTDLTYTSYFEFIHPEDKAYVTEQVEKAIKDKKFHGFSHRIITTSGKIKIIQLLGKLSTNEKGETIEMLGACQDITIQKMAENKFRGLLESAPDAMVIVNDHGTIDLVNKQSEKLFGYTAAELIGKPVELLIPKRFTGKHTGHRDGFFSNPKTRKMGEGKELYGINKKGKEIPIQISLSPLQTEDGMLVSAAIRDITVQKLAEIELLNKNQLLNRAEKMSLMGHWHWDTINDKAIWSDTLYQMFEIDDQIIDLKFSDYFSFVHPEDKDLVEEFVGKSFKDKTFHNFSHRILTTTGKLKTVQIFGEMLTDEKGDIIEIIGSQQDITAQKLAERKLIEAKENLEVFSKKLISQNTALADFTQITSHNLRAPVSNLNSLLEFYKISESEEEKIDLFDKFETVIEHLTITLNTLIEALRTKNETNKELEVISFAEVLNKTLEIQSGEILKVKAVIISDFSKIENVNFNRIYLESIFLNLISNALKYKAEDRIPELFIESEVIDGKIKLKFKDNGLGIDLERHGHKLFGLNIVFHRHPDAKGVGLYMTKTQIEAMGGAISVTSIVNEGTTFTINF